MSLPCDPRRRFLARMVGTGVLGSLAGCTAIGTVGVDLAVENTGTGSERTEYYVDRGEATGARTIELEAGAERTVPVEIGRGDAVVVSKGELGFECTLDDYVCRDPTVQVDIGAGALGVSGACFDISPL